MTKADFFLSKSKYLSGLQCPKLLTQTQAIFDQGHKVTELAHAVLPDLKRFAESMDPGVIIPIHTEHPDKYREHFGNKVHCLKDGEMFEL